MMILGGAEHHEQARTLEVGPAEFPERAADGVDHAGGHVDRAETAVGGVVRRAELLGEQAGQRLHLVAAGVQGESLRIGIADVLQPLADRGQGFFPADLFERRLAALGPGLAPQRFTQPRRRVLLHDAGRALGAEHALVDRVLGIALDEAHLAVLDGDPDAAATGAHVAGGVFHLALPGGGLRHIVMPVKPWFEVVWSDAGRDAKQLI